MNDPALKQPALHHPAVNHPTKPVRPSPAPADPVDGILGDLAARLPGARVIDVGGGSGTRAVPLARRGCSVLVVDSSIDALAILGRRAADAGVADRISGVQADADALSGVVTQGGADLALCHHLLETVDDPAAVVSAITGALRPGGVVSILVAGRFAAILSQAVAGRAADSLAMLVDPAGSFGQGDPLLRRYEVSSLNDLLTGCGLIVDEVIGVDVASGLLSGARRGTAEDGLIKLDSALSTHRELREIGADLHALAHKPDATAADGPDSSGRPGAARQQTT